MTSQGAELFTGKGTDSEGKSFGEVHLREMQSGQASWSDQGCL
jgi:hypothetical protein